MLIVGGTNILVFPMSIATSVLLARLLPKPEYGLLVYFYSGTGLLRLLINFGLGTILSRDVAASWDEAERLNVVVYSLGLVRLLSILTLVPILLVIFRFGSIESFGSMIVAALCASLADFVFAIVAGSRLTWHISAMTAFQPAIYLVAALGSIAVGQVNAHAIMLVYALSFLALVVLGGSLTAATHRLRRPARAYMQLSYVKSSVGYAVPSYLASLLSQTWSTTVTGALGLAGQFEQSAEFGIALSIVTLSMTIGGPTLLTAFFPQASYLHGSKRHAELLAYIRHMLSLFLKGLIWVVLLLSCFADLLVAVFGAQYAAAAPYIVALAPVALVMGILPLLTLSLFAIGRPWRTLPGLLAQLGTLFAVLSGGSILTTQRLTAAVLLSATIGFMVQMATLAFTLKTVPISKNVAVAILVAVSLVVLLRILSVCGIPEVGQILVALLGSVVYGFVALRPHARYRPVAVSLKDYDDTRA